MSLTTGTYFELRGTTYHLRMRVPKEFADVEPLKEVNRSLRTRDPIEAQALAAHARHALIQDWQARRAQRVADHRALFDMSTELLKGWGMTFCAMDDLVTGPLDELLKRIDAIANVDPNSVAVPAVLGAIELPDVSLDEMALRMPELKKANIRAKNARQRREWCGNFKRAASDFKTVIGERTVFAITSQDATDYEDFWMKRAASGEVTANYANKQIRYVRQMIDAHFADIRLPKEKRKNPFFGMRVEKIAYDEVNNDRKRMALPNTWIKKRLIGEKVLEGLNQEASDIAIVSAVCGCRASEIYDLPPEDIFLDHEIPHISLRIVLDGPDRRELKGQASTRKVVLLGAALEAMKRHPEGFSGYRGKANYSGPVNKYLRDNSLFPDVPADESRHHVISGLRHSFEDRMINAGIANEERAYLMGHSIGRVRGRPVYGTALDLPFRALFQEMVSFGGEGWSPRPVDVLQAEVDRLMKERGHVLPK